jgi:signal transduction histidine kinase
MTPLPRRWWDHWRVLAVPLLLWAVVLGLLWKPVRGWLKGREAQDRAVLREWLQESRGDLPGLVKDYVGWLQDADPDQIPSQFEPGRKSAHKSREPSQDQSLLENELNNRREKILEQLDAMATPPTKMYNSTLPLFPTIYRIRIVVNVPRVKPIVWDSNLPTEAGDYEEIIQPMGDAAQAEVRYQLHAYDKRQRDEAQRGSRVRQLSLLAVIATTLAAGWVVFVQRRGREEDRRRAEAQAQLDQAERARLQEELRRQEAERRQQQAERDLLQQQLAAQEYEQKMLEMKSQFYASVGIMAGSYAHNIKNLLVRPNDLLHRCLDSDGVSPDQKRRIEEVQLTLGTVTERLQQILQTVRRDPSRSEMSPLDLRGMLRDLEQTWKDLAWEKWKLQLVVEAAESPLWIDGDLSHLQQAVENLLFNARDATFAMRLALRNQARESDPATRRQALLDAAAWKGRVVIHAHQEGDGVLVSVSDNGIGMTDEVRRRCTETHFTTKRDDAGYEGHSTGMGLGLSFTKVVLDNHGASLEIDSEPLSGTTFRLRFPAVGAPPEKR